MSGIIACLYVRIQALDAKFQSWNVRKMTADPSGCGLPEVTHFLGLPAQVWRDQIVVCRVLAMSSAIESGIEGASNKTGNAGWNCDMRE